MAEVPAAGTLSPPLHPVALEIASIKFLLDHKYKTHIGFPRDDMARRDGSNARRRTQKQKRDSAWRMSEEGFMALFPVTLCLPTIGTGGSSGDHDTILGLRGI